ncbi:MAG TPA: hypothetical protein VL463_06540 [Kofleriaceae bacterium]|nr:hypothetical protein [Kofleriaceae bacterium]
MNQSVDTSSTGEAIQSELKPSHHVKNQAGGGGGGAQIKYHNGPVIEGTVNVYFVWYGNWSGNTAPAILTDLASSIGGSPYYKINTPYYDVISNVKHFVSGAVHYAGSTTDNYSYGTTLDDNTVFAVVDDAVTSGRLPEDTNGIYFVMTSADVQESSGFCTQYCGWHWYDIDSNGKELRYAFVGDASTQCPSGCMEQTTGPNGNAGADGMASVFSHELEEANTDPRGTAWYDARGQENADKCAWTFGTTYKTANGALANMKLGARDFLIQRNWKLSTQSCGLN